MRVAGIPLPKGAADQTPQRIVIHSMGEFIDTATDDFHAVEFLRHIGLSAHAFITPSGVVIRSRKDEQGAYHAKGYNTDSLGVEFLVPGLHTYGSFVDAIAVEYLTDAQYTAGVALVQEWLDNHTIMHVDRHSDLRPSRKVDPGAGFPWEKFRADVGL